MDHLILQVTYIEKYLVFAYADVVTLCKSMRRPLGCRCPQPSPAFKAACVPAVSSRQHHDRPGGRVAAVLAAAAAPGHDRGAQPAGPRPGDRQDILPGRIFTKIVVLHTITEVPTGPSPSPKRFHIKTLC